jgi:hypothetical protein
MTTEELTTNVEAANDPAKQLGNLESWNGQRVYVLRDDMGHFVTWRKADERAASEQATVATDGGRDTIEWTTDSGSDVTVSADNGTLFVTLQGTDETGAGVSFDEQSATLTCERGTDVLDCGKQRDDSGERFHAFVPLEVNRDEIEQLKEDSIPEQTDEPLTFTVEEYTKKSRAGGWGEREITKQRLSRNKSHAEMTDRQRKLNGRVDTDRVPDDAEPGDVLTFEGLLDDARTSEEKDQDALDEAAETGEEVVINKSTTGCNDSSKECNLDHVSRVATPEGNIETRRTHTY